MDNLYKKRKNWAIAKLQAAKGDFFQANNSYIYAVFKKITWLSSKYRMEEIWQDQYRKSTLNFQILMVELLLLIKMTKNYRRNLLIQQGEKKPSKKMCLHLISERDHYFLITWEVLSF